MGVIKLTLDEFAFLHKQIKERFVREHHAVDVSRLTQKQCYGYDDYNENLPNIRAAMIAIGKQQGLFSDYAYDTFNGKYLYNGLKDMERHALKKEFNARVSIGGHSSMTARLFLLYAGYENLESFYEDFEAQNNPKVLEFEGYAYYNMLPQLSGKIYTYTLSLTQKQKTIDELYTAELKFIYDGQRVNRHSTGIAKYSEEYLFIQLNTKERNQHQYFLTLFPNGDVLTTQFMRGMLQIVSKDSQIVSTQIFFLPRKSAESNPALVEQVKQQVLQQKKQIRLEVRRIYRIEHFLNEET